MKAATRVLAGLVAAFAFGCRGSGHLSDADREFDAALVTTLNDEAIVNAIIVQHTLFPFHFVPGAASLNGLGQHDFGVLVDYYRKHAGSLNVRRGDAPPDLYDQRVAEVKRLLADEGVAADRVSVSDDLAGGEGLKAERVLVIAGRETKP